MLNDGSVSKQTVAVLDKYLRHHKLHSVSNKKAKLSAVQRHITHQSTATSQTAEMKVKLKPLSHHVMRMKLTLFLRKSVQAPTKHKQKEMMLK